MALKQRRSDLTAAPARGGNKCRVVWYRCIRANHFSLVPGHWTGAALSKPGEWLMAMKHAPVDPAEPDLAAGQLDVLASKDVPAQPIVPQITAADGCRLTLADLPSPGTKRWVARRKAAVVAAVRGGLLSLDEACRRYALNSEEFQSWQRCIDCFGFAGLRTTRLQFYLGNLGRAERALSRYYLAVSDVKAPNKGPSSAA